MTPELERLLIAAKARWDGLSPREKELMIKEQRRSYVIAEAAIGDDADEAAYRKAMKENDAETVMRLDLESQERADKALLWLNENGF